MSNNYTGGTVINAGTLSLADPSAIGAATNALTINAGGIFQATGTFSSARSITLGGTGGASSGGTFDVTGANVETQTGGVGGTGSLIKTGTGTLSMNGTNTYTGDTYVLGGTVAVSGSQSLGPQPPSLGSPLYAVHLAGGTTLQTAVTSVGGNRQLELMNGTATLDVASGFSQQRNATVYGAGGLVKSGAGIEILAAANTYGGGTTINNGILEVNNLTGSATGSGAVAVNSGGTLSALPLANGFANAGSVAGIVTVNAGGDLLARSGYTFTLGGLTLNSSAVTSFQLGAPTNLALINLSGGTGLNLAGLSTVNIANFGGGVAAGTYHLFDYNGTALSSITNLQLGSTPGGGYTYSLSNNTTNSSVDLLVSLSNVQWANDIDGNWNLTSNWTSGVVPNSVGAQANFFGAIQVARTATVDGAFTIGTMTFNSANAYTIASDNVAGHGLTFNNGGAASISVLSGAHTISAPVSLTDNLEITAASGAALTINSAIGQTTSGRTATIDGAGTVTFGGATANSYTGLTEVGLGTLNLGKSAGVNAISTGGLQIDGSGTVALLASNQIADTASVNNNGTFAFGTFSETIAALNGGGSVTLGAGSNLTIGASNNLSSRFDGVISGSGTIGKAGTGTFTLGGTNTFGGAGQTIGLNAGALQISSDANLGNSANSLTFNGGSLLLSAAVTSARNLALAGSGTIDTNNNAATFSGTISGTGPFAKAGVGVLTLTGSNSYTGGTAINGTAGSVLAVSSDSNLGSTSTASLAAGLNLSAGGALETTATLATARQIHLGATGGSQRADGSYVSGVVNVDANTTLTLSGQITGDANSRLEKDGAGLLFLNNLDSANKNSFGSLYLHGGLTVTGNGSQFGGAGLVLTADNGAGLLSNQTGAFVTTVHVGNGGHLRESGLGWDVFRNGLIDNVAGQSGGLTYTGDETASGGAAANAGKQGLGGTNTFTGNVSIGTNFTLSISQNANLGNATNQLLINGGTLAVEDGVSGASLTSVGAPIAATFATSRRISLSGNSIFDVKNTFDAIANPTASGLAAHTNTLTLDGIISGSGTLVKNGPGTLVINNTANNYTGGTVLNAGTISTGPGTVLGASTGSLTINNNAIYQSNGDKSSSRPTVLGGTGGPAGVGGGTFDVTGSFTESRSGVVSGAGSLTKTGTGTLVLSGANTYTGGTFLNAGTLAISSGALGAVSALTTIGNGTLEVLQDITTSRNFTITSANSAMQVDPGTTYTLNGVISGTGLLNKTNDGVLALNGANTYTGGTAINGGTVIVNSAANLGNGGALRLNAATLEVATGHTESRNMVLGDVASTIQVDPAQTYTVSGVLSGSGSLTKSGTGNLTLTGINNFTGDTVVDYGTLTAASATGRALANTATITVNDAGTLLLGASNQINTVAAITLNGGTIAKGNFSEGSTTAAGFGALTLAGPASNLDFGAGTVGILSFANFSPGSNLDVLIIDNWTGVANTLGTASTDRLIFNADQTSNLAYFSFTGYTGAAELQIGSTGFYEIVPQVSAVPEPSTYATAVLAAMGLAAHLFRRRRKTPCE